MGDNNPPLTTVTVNLIKNNFNFPSHILPPPPPTYLYQVWIPILLLQTPKREWKANIPAVWVHSISKLLQWLELLLAQENKFDACTLYTKIMLKPFRVKFHALFGLSTYTGCQKGSSKKKMQDCRYIRNFASLSLGCRYIGHLAFKGQYNNHILGVLFTSKPFQQPSGWGKTALSSPHLVGCRTVSPHL
jgi:hypothetical protein